MSRVHDVWETLRGSIKGLRKRPTQTNYNWLDEDMGMCERHPDIPVMFSNKGDYTPICVVCLKEYLDD
jgi:hypothetical protein